MTDPIADMLTRIRNGQTAHLAYVSVPLSKFKLSVLKILQKEGYIKNFIVEEGVIRVDLKYNAGKPAIKIIDRISKPGRKVYSEIAALRKFMNGLGVIILSTSKGVMSDYEAKSLGVGGEVLCKVF